MPMALIQAVGMDKDKAAMPRLNQLKFIINRTTASTKASKVMVVIMMTNMSILRCTKSILSLLSIIRFSRKFHGESSRTYTAP